MCPQSGRYCGGADSFNRRVTGLGMNPNKDLWEKVDFTRIAASFRESGEALVNELGIVDGLEALDLG